MTVFREKKMRRLNRKQLIDAALPVEVPRYDEIALAVDGAWTAQ